MTTMIQEMITTLDAFDKSRENTPIYLFWRQYMELVLLLLRFTRAFRSGNWELYLTSIAEMVPWFALYDHTHYTRWATVFLADTKQLPTRAPTVHRGFCVVILSSKKLPTGSTRFQMTKALNTLTSWGR